MQIVIDINENDYKTLMINGGNCSISMAERIVDSVFQGKKLPNHGRLIDANALRSMESINRANFNTVVGIQKWIDYAQTIIEADAESEGKELKNEKL